MVRNRRERERGKVVMDGQKLRGEKPREALAQEKLQDWQTEQRQRQTDCQSLDQGSQREGGVDNPTPFRSIQWQQAKASLAKEQP